jgi:hypothetical protein
LDQLRHPGAFNKGAQATEEICFRHWFRKQVALPDLAADRLQLVALPGCFNAFGDSAQTEPAAELDDRLAQASL